LQVYMCLGPLAWGLALAALAAYGRRAVWLGRAPLLFKVAGLLAAAGLLVWAVMCLLPRA